MSEQGFKIHKSAAAKDPRPRRRRRQPVADKSIDPRVMRTARRLAKGDMSRVTLDPKTGSAYVWNQTEGR